jgi:hypothetical protein
MPKKIAILQSNYIPWKGYFDLISSVDELILFDKMQFTKRNWRNRNLILTPLGLQWLTIPVVTKGRYLQAINETEISDENWGEDHWKALVMNYSKSPFFKEITTWLEPLYLNYSFNYLSDINRLFIEAICKYLEINTRISTLSNYSLVEGKNERLIDLCKQAGANEYISGPAAQDYIDQGLFSENGVKLTWFDYGGYPEYRQLSDFFIHGVSILDLLFCCGRDSHLYMKNVSRT